MKGLAAMIMTFKISDDGNNNGDHDNLKLLMCIFKLLIQVQISPITGNLYLVDKVTHIVNKTTKQKESKNKNSAMQVYKLRLHVSIFLSALSGSGLVQDLFLMQKR